MLNPDSWTKKQEPVFQSYSENGQHGPGHNSFTESEDGNDTILVYHARNYTDLIGDPLYEPNRYARAQKLEWDENDDPIFTFSTL